MSKPNAVRLWHPCRKGFPDPENCPHCTPPAEDRCPEYLAQVVGDSGNSPDARTFEVRLPCRVLGEHTIHRDGRGTSWWTEEPDESEAG